MRLKLTFAFVCFFMCGISFVHADTVITKVTSNSYWPLSGSPYIISDIVTIPRGVIVTMDPGVVVKLASKLTVDGTLDAEGTPVFPITFTSYSDDSVGGDSNGDGTTTTAMPWSGIVFEVGSRGDLYHTVVRYGGMNGFNVASASLVNAGGDVIIRDSLFSDMPARSAIENDGGATAILNTEFAAGANFDVYSTGGVVNIQDSNFHDSPASAVWTKSTNLNIERTTFAGNLDASVSFQYPGTFTHIDDHFENNRYNGFSISGTMDADETFTSDAPYIISSLTVDPSTTLTIDPGAVLKMGAIYANGTVNAVGTKELPITFTSLKDDSAGGDTNNDGNASMPTNRDWQVIEVRPGGKVNLSFATVKYGGASSGDFFTYWPMLGNFNGTLSIDHSTIGGSEAWSNVHTEGESATTTITNSQIIVGEQFGIKEDGGALSIHQSSITGDGAAIFAANFPDITVNAENNWWGDASGPQATDNPQGKGTSIQTYGEVINDSPWLTRDPFATSTPVHNPVLIVPGVLGTEIYKGSDKLWLDIVHTVTDIGDQFMDPLQFGTNVLPLDTNVTIGNVIGKEIVDPSVLKIPVFDYTDGLVKQFEGEGYSIGTDLFLLPYDWRYGINSSNVEALADKIREIRSQTGSDKVDLVAHSTGGLLVKRYMMDHFSDNHIDKAVFVGVPNTGAPKAIKVLLQGDNFGDPFLSDGEMKKIAANLPVVYDLLPSKNYYDQNGSSVEIDDHGLFSSTSHNLDFADAESFLTGDHGLNSQAMSETNDLHNNSLDGFDPRTAGVDLSTIVGCKTGTVGKVVETRTQTLLTGTQLGYKVQYVPGDGTVPFGSAAAIPTDVQNEYYALDADHSEMLSQDGIRQEIVNIITGTNLDVGDKVTQRVSKCGLNGKTITIFSPLRMDIADQNGNHAGLDADGNVYNEIPDASFDVFGEHKSVYLPTSEGQTYTVSLNGTGAGIFTLEDSEIANNQVTQTATFSDIPVTTNLSGSLDLQSSTLALDNNNDGIVDQTVSPDEGETSLRDLLIHLTTEVQALSIKDKAKQNLIKKIENVETKIENKEQKNAKVIANFEAKIAKQAAKGKIDSDSADDISAMLDDLEAQAETVPLDPATLVALGTKIQATGIKQNQKDNLLKRINSLESNQRIVKTLSNFTATITKKGSNGKLDDTDAQHLLDLLGEIGDII